MPARVTYKPRDAKSGGLTRLGWRAECPVKACKFGSWHLTHNGAHIAKARHNRTHALVVS